MGPSRRGLAALFVVMLGLSGALVGCVPNAKAGVVSPTTPGEATIRYGPFRVPAATPGRMGMIRNNFAFDVQRPCTNCYITSMQAGLVTPDGRSANIDRGLWLHHMVLFDTSKTDVTCPSLGVGALGQRFFSSGNERTPTDGMAGYGYPQGTDSRWNLIYDLMNMTAQPANVTIRVDFDYVPLSTPGMRPLTPIWLDINQCGNSERPALDGKFTYDYSLTSQWTGKLLGIAGHLHDGGVNVTISKNGRQACDSRAVYGGTPAYVEGSNSLHMPGMAHISKMTLCNGTPANPVMAIVPGDKIDLAANYDMTQHHADGHPVMGIAIGYWDLG